MDIKTFFIPVLGLFFSMFSAMSQDIKQEVYLDKDGNKVKVKSFSSEGLIKPDIYLDSKGNELMVALVGHGSVAFYYKNKVIHVDPYSRVADYSKLPKADLIILTHEHGDHLDKNAIDSVKKADTKFIVSEICEEELGYGEVIKNGEKTSFAEVAIEAVPAYNIVNKRSDGIPYHPKGRGNGYIFTFDNLRVYIAGDTENIPEMTNLGKIDIAFLPKNLPYTMSDEMFVDAVKKVSPKYLYPYHFSEINEAKLKAELRDIDTRILVRPMSNLKKQ